VRLMYEQKTNQSNLLTVCLTLGCALWSVKYGNYFWSNEVLRLVWNSARILAICFPFRISIPFSIPNAHFSKIQYLFKVLKTNFESQYFFNTFNAAWEPCEMNCRRCYPWWKFRLGKQLFNSFTLSRLLHVI